MKIKSKADAATFMTNFNEVAKHDELGGKLYFCFEEKGSDKIITLMKYPNGDTTINRRSNNWHQDGETLLHVQETWQLVWDNRANINKLL